MTHAFPVSLLAACLALFGVRAAAAQQACSPLSSKEEFTLTASGGGVVGFLTAGASDFMSTWTVVTRTYSVTVDPKKKSRAWELCIGTQSSTMTNGKAVSDLEWRLAGTSTWFPMTTTAARVMTGLNTQTVTIDFRMRLSWSLDAPAYYAAPFWVVAL